MLSSKEQWVISPSHVKVQEVITICWILGGLYFKLSVVEYHLDMLSVSRTVLAFLLPLQSASFFPPTAFIYLL